MLIFCYILSKYYSFAKYYYVQIMYAIDGGNIIRNYTKGM